MTVVINGEARSLDTDASLAAVVGLFTNAQTGVAVAVNGEVVRRSVWDTTQLSDGDEVEVLTAVQGG
jgi:sulfur carrier protein